MQNCRRSMASSQARPCLPRTQVTFSKLPRFCCSNCPDPSTMFLYLKLKNNEGTYSLPPKPHQVQVHTEQTDPPSVPAVPSQHHSSPSPAALRPSIAGIPGSSGPAGHSHMLPQLHHNSSKSLKRRGINYFLLKLPPHYRLYHQLGFTPNCLYCLKVKQDCPALPLRQPRSILTCKQLRINKLYKHKQMQTAVICHSW